MQCHRKDRAPGSPPSASQLAQGTHCLRQEAALCLSFSPEVTELRDICQGGVLAGGRVGEKEGQWGQSQPLLPHPSLPYSSHPHHLLLLPVTEERRGKNKSDEMKERTGKRGNRTAETGVP